MEPRFQIYFRIRTVAFALMLIMYVAGVNDVRAQRSDFFNTVVFLNTQGTTSLI